MLHPELGPISRSFKPIPSDYVRQLLIPYLSLGLDGEIVAYDLETGKLLPFNQISSLVMSTSKVPPAGVAIRYEVFDCILEPQSDFATRYHRLRYIYETQLNAQQMMHISSPLPWTLVPHIVIESATDLALYEEAMLDAGYEGVMVNSPSGKYKYGRSTTKEGTLLKVKRFEDEEAYFLGVIPMQHNTNTATTNALGYTERSSARAGLVELETMGVLVGQSQRFGRIEIGTGFSQADRDWIWEHRLDLIGNKFTYKFQAHGSLDKPRLPVFKGWRHKEDLS